MNEKQVSQHLWAARSSVNWRQLLARFRVVILFVVLFSSGTGIALADPLCFAQCQAGLANCMAEAQGDPALEFQCQVGYDQCGELCMRQ